MKALRWRKPKKVKAESDPNGARSMRGGEPVFLGLDYYEEDSTLSTYQFSVCCGCGYVHLYDYSVFCDKNGQYWLRKAGYGDTTTLPKKVVRRKK